MNETIAVLNNHRSVRKFKPQPIPDEHLRLAVQAGQHASTSSNIQAYSLLHITDKSKRAALVVLTGGQPQVADCGAFFIICGDLRRHKILAGHASEPFQPSLEAFLLATIDASLFAQNLVVAFESLGYGICYIGGLRNDLPAVDKLLNIPVGVLPFYGICAGVPADTPDLKPRFNHDAVCFKNQYPTDEQMLDHINEYDNRCRTYYLERTGKEHAWSTTASRKFAKPARTNLAEYYRSKGASLD